MREECSSFLTLVHYFRITPAHAGRMPPHKTYAFVTLDHPRACGKNFSNPETVTIDVGSPPRMREEFANIFNSSP